MVKPSGLLAGILLTLLAAASLASMDTLAKFLVADLPAIQVLWGRYLFHAVIMTVWLAATVGPRFLRTRQPAVQVLRGLVLLAGSTFAYLALQFLPLATTTAVQFFGPVLVTVWSTLFLGERIGPTRIVAVLTGFLGVVIIIRPGFGTLDPAVLLPLAGAFAFSVYFLLTRRLAGPEERRAALFHTTAVGSIVLSFAVPFVWQAPSASQWALLVAVGSLGALGHFGIVAAFAFATAATLTPYLYAQVVFASLLSTLVIGDPLHANVVLGATILVASGIVIWWRENYGPRARPEDAGS